ncbi:MAG: hypothetical protein L0229_09725 [Blastocatellia bacterium]|nr:hypothetical protein [Blastocatellia bacterium]
MIEMAIILLVIAIIAAAVVPQALNYMRMYRVGVAARNVATALQRARFLATSNNTRAGVQITALRRIEILQFDREGTVVPQNKGIVQLPEEITIPSDAPIEIAFDGRGVVTPLPKESPAIRVIGARGYYIIVTVSPTGQVTLSEVQSADA